MMLQSLASCVGVGQLLATKKGLTISLVLIKNKSGCQKYEIDEVITESKLIRDDLFTKLL